jgi:hypothetical protein
MFVSLRALDFPDRFIRHQNFLGELTSIVSELDKNDATFSSINDFGVGTQARIRPATNFSLMCLRHQDFRIKLHEFNPPISGPNSRPETPEEKLLREDCTFTVRGGLADSAGISFESVNVPGHFIRHRDFHLFLEPANSDLARRDATFIKAPPFIPEAPSPIH